MAGTSGGSASAMKASVVIRTGRERSGAVECGVDQGMAAQERSLRKLDDQDLVLRRQTDGCQQRDTRVDIVLEAASFRPDHRADQAQHDHQQHRVPVRIHLSDAPAVDEIVDVLVDPRGTQRRAEHEQIVDAAKSCVTRNGCHRASLVQIQNAIITIDPLTISAPPSATGQLRVSPATTTPSTIAITTLSLSIGATRETGPSCNAR